MDANPARRVAFAQTSGSSGRSIVFQEKTGLEGALQLHAADTLGARRLLLADASSFRHSLQPAFSADGSGLFFAGSRAVDQPTGIYRANPDGSSPHFLMNGWEPAPSPNGSHLAYTDVGVATLHVREVGGGVAVNPTTPAVQPRWSPAGDLIAFVKPGTRSEVIVMRPDGTERRSLESTLLYQPQLAWSPDGQWLVVARVDGVLDFVRIADGIHVPISGTHSVYEVAWRR